MTVKIQDGFPIKNVLLPVLAWVKRMADCLCVPLLTKGEKFEVDPLRKMIGRMGVRPTEKSDEPNF